MTTTTRRRQPAERPDAGGGETGLDAVTGAFSYSGGAIARQLLRSGRRVRTLTGHPERAGFDHTGTDQTGSDHRGSDHTGDDTAIEVRPLDFDDLPGLTASLQGVTTLYNTYWVRFAHAGIDHEIAVEHSRTLFTAARRAGVAKVVHVSILHPSVASPYPYFRGKALVERALAETGLAFAVLRPSVLFDERGVLLNNIAWMLRRLPVFAVGGSGRYRVRPTHVDDLARLAVDAAAWPDDRIVDAVGPERPTFVELVDQIRDAVGSKARIIRVPGPVLLAASKLLGAVLHDVVLTSEEYHTMVDGLADSDADPTGSVALSSWLGEHGGELGLTYANELERHFR